MQIISKIELLVNNFNYCWDGDENIWRLPNCYVEVELNLTNNYNEKWITLNDNKIKEFLEKNEICIVIVLYSSCNKLLEIVKRLPYTFDFKVGDECHHLTGEYDEYDEGNVK